ncbi:Peptidase family M48 [Musa troglodytarum]|uniref:Peptidase family M48 n=1 Tax=Musa troglodytarum TaxID=320322 RepID=A0A9E7KCD0_9LILI|nr:Peptidase family M48 [Musa troglodytarum]
MRFLMIGGSTEGEEGRLGSPNVTKHLEGLNWEILVVRDDTVNAFCLPGGKIVVFTSLLDHFRSDAEIATVIGHEVAHAIARHSAEMITKNLWFATLQLILLQFFAMPDLISAMSNLLLRLPFSRSCEEKRKHELHKHRKLELWRRGYVYRCGAPRLEVDGATRAACAVCVHPKCSLKEAKKDEEEHDEERSECDGEVYTNFEDSEDSEDLKDSEDSEDFKDCEDCEDFKDSEDSE